MARRAINPLDDPHVWAAMLASQWARQIGLTPGNLWEPAICRNVVREYERLGADANARAMTETIYRMQLGLDHA